MQNAGTYVHTVTHSHRCLAGSAFLVQYFLLSYDAVYNALIPQFQISKVGDLSFQ